MAAEESRRGRPPKAYLRFLSQNLPSSGRRIIGNTIIEFQLFIHGDRVTPLDPDLWTTVLASIIFASVFLAWGTSKSAQFLAKQKSYPKQTTLPLGRRGPTREMAAV